MVVTIVTNKEISALRKSAEWPRQRKSSGLWLSLAIITNKEISSCLRYGDQLGGLIGNQ